MQLRTQRWPVSRRLAQGYTEFGLLELERVALERALRAAAGSGAARGGGGAVGGSWRLPAGLEEIRRFVASGGLFLNRGMSGLVCQELRRAGVKPRSHREARVAAFEQLERALGGLQHPLARLGDGSCAIGAAWHYTVAL